MFENLTEKLQRVFKNLRGQGKLTEEHLDAAVGQIREALLDGDVNVGVADELLAKIRAKAQGAEVMLQRSEEHTSELQSLAYLVCRLLLEKKKKSQRNDLLVNI